MKEEIFNLYVDRVASAFKLQRSDLFIKTKKREYVDARHLLYYLCYKRPIRMSYIIKYMADNGYNAQHSSVVNGVNAVEKRMKYDRDYVNIVRIINQNQ
jgi:chromosomal replication initiation ATPase DnaA